jgi:tol-pal system protein YbgF
MTGDPDQAYSAAFNALKTGKYDDAIAQFNNFLVTYPDSPRADSAQYWLGEAYYVNKQYDPAIIEYQKLVAAYPGSQKVSQAMLKIGFCQQELGQSDQARITLQEVVQRYPGTTSARMAEDRLQRMRLEQPP